MKKIIFIILSGLLVTACDNTPSQPAAGAMNEAGTPEQAVAPRWYTQEQVKRGDELFQKNCAVCHKPDASGTKNWQELDANGKLPPPPLNGTAHTWHHSMAILHRAIREGGIPLGGSMPPFKDKLNKDDINDILAWVMSHWSDKVYGIWYQRQQQSRK